MSDTIGVIGQQYEDRKSKKTGILVKRDAEEKKLYFLGENAEPFNVSFAAFKSNWRKVVSEAPANDVVWPEDEVVEAPEVEPETTTESLDEDAKIKDFVKALTDARVASVDIVGDSTMVMADDIVICTLDKVANGYKVFMLPDIFIFTEWHDTFKASDVHFNIKQGRHAGVLVDCVKASLGDILQYIKTAAVEINLYGYID